MKRQIKQRLAKIIYLAGGLGIGILVFLIYNGYIWPNSYFAYKYQVQGIDVSAYQGMINWETVAQNKRLHFVFIKASEGMDYQDSYFRKNWDESNNRGILRGAYHYFRTTSSGLAQARNFESIVPAEQGSLPPVVDVEEDGLKEEELKTFLDELESHYKQKPIIYVVYPLYDKYIKNEFTDYPIWIRDVIKTPRLSDGREWSFWQYCNRGRIKGIDTFVDINIYAKDYEELRKLTFH
ncbi:Lysozyme M1 precursor [Sporomusa ovata DSM 2662]|nr:GH25 family lysozyme [Sporomusa ovata]EQB25299.1 lyzozyme M1 [Sporomusa ovata DSM 2662]